MIITRTPLRFSLIGGGSDLPAYWMNYGPSKFISMTISPSMYVTFQSRNAYPMNSHGYDSAIRVGYTRIEQVDDMLDIEHDLIRVTLQNASRYCRKTRDLLGRPFEITTIGTIPGKGSGLGTSSALVVGLMKLLFPNAGNEELLALSGAVEIEGLNRNIGLQDQMAAIYGGMRIYQISTEGNVSEIAIPRGFWLATRLIAFKLPGRKTEHEQDAKSNPVHDQMNQDMESRATFLTRTVEMVEPMYRALISQNISEVAKILQEAWYLKTMSHAIKDDVIDKMCQLGQDAGALAWKVSGSVSDRAGHLFFLAEPDVIPGIRGALSGFLPELDFQYWNSGVIRMEM